MKILLTLIATVICAILYRAGGMGKEEDAEPKWMPMWMRETWVRDWMIPLVVLGTLLCFRQPIVWWGWLLVVLTVLPFGGALTTYWDELFGFDNFWFSGFMVGLALFPLYWVGFYWYMILARALILAVLWGGWCAVFSKDTTEEYGRGAFVALTILLLI